MRLFSQLYVTLDETNRTSEKVAAMENYFRTADPADAAWALYFLCGRKVPRAVTSTQFRAWAAEASGLSTWLFDECYQTVGDLAETVTLLLPEASPTLDVALHDWVVNRLLPLRSAAEEQRRESLVQTWRELSGTELFVWNKLLTGGFRVGVSRSLVVRALAVASGIAAPIMAHRLLGNWQATAENFQDLLNSDSARTVALPYPFFLASPLTSEPPSLGVIEDWQAEWKWDGIRAQLIRREGEILIWSRGEDAVTASFPEIAEAATALPDGTVLDGEILAWQDEQPLPFSSLQHRLSRKLVTAKMRANFPVIFMAYDLLEFKGEDLRQQPLETRRSLMKGIMLEAMQQAVQKSEPIWETPDLFEKSAKPITKSALRLSEILQPDSWEALTSQRLESRNRLVEGVMLKRRVSPYGVGRQRGDWWKWKIDPLTLDMVLVSAQQGHGRRAGLFTDYTFAVWDQGALAPVAKAYSGLSDAEILKVDAFVKANTTAKYGPIRAVKPLLVFELAFEGVQKSTRHKAGLAVRFPRIHRWRLDKPPAEADTLDSLHALMQKIVCQ